MKAVILKTSAILLASLSAVASPGQTFITGETSLSGLSHTTPKATMLTQKAPGSIDISWEVIKPSNLTLTNFYIYSVEDPWFRGSNFIEAPQIASLPEGQYFFQFTAVDYLTQIGYVYISRILDLTKETQFTFDLNECTHKVKTKTMLPDGREALTPTWRSSLGGFDTDGTVTSSNLELTIHRRNGGLTVSIISSIPKLVEDNGEIIELGTSFFVNKPEGEYDMFVITAHEQKDNYDKIWTLHALPMENLGEETLIYSPSDSYIKFDANYGELADIPMKYEDNPGQRNAFFVLQNDCITDITGWITTSFNYSSASYVYVENRTQSSISPLFRYGEVDAGDIDKGSGSPIFYSVNSLPITIENGKARYNAYISDDFYINNDLMQPDGGPVFFLDKRFTSHPRFSWDHNPERVLTLGNSTPLLVMTTSWQPGNKSFSYITPAYYGRYGERREPDLYGSYAEVEIDGEKVFNGSGAELQTWTKEEFSLPKAKGNYTFTLEDDCATVDGMPSLNKTIIKCNASGSDREAPTFTFLNFRNQDDEITDRFENGAEGTLEFSAADLSSQINEHELPWFKVSSPLSVKVEYAAEDSEEYSPLAFEEVPELFFSPCFGSFYRAPLSGVTKGSATGWFKLRLTATDEAGNSQEQTLSPLFYIASSASVDEIAPEFDGEAITADGTINVYDLQGRLVKSGKDRLDTTGLIGMYIVRSNGRSVKITL